MSLLQGPRRRHFLMSEVSLNTRLNTSPRKLPVDPAVTIDPEVCEDRIGTDPPRARTEVIYVDL
jgi:hypothetical protein